MKAWRLEAEAINARRKEGSREPRARVQMQEQRMINRTFKPKGSGNWLLDGLLIRGGFEAAVYGDPIKTVRRPLPGDGGKSILSKIMSKAKAWWNKG